jgi:hypothetical protein
MFGGAQGLGVGVLTLVLASPVAARQKADPSTLPDAPIPKQEQAQQNHGKNPLTAPIGLIAKRSYVFPEIAHTPGPLTAGDKFKLFLGKSSSPSQIFSSLSGAAIGQARDSLPGYGQGWDGYAKRFSSSLASGASTQFFDTFLLSSMLHNDPRYFVTMTGGWRHRVGRALMRVVVVRTDDGLHERFNVPGTLGPLMAEGLANAYLPDAERTAGKTFERFGIRMGMMAGSNLIKEYWPTIFKSLRLGKVAPDLKPRPSP